MAADEPRTATPRSCEGLLGLLHDRRRSITKRHIRV
jgi:hypothetical protein